VSREDLYLRKLGCLKDDLRVSSSLLGNPDGDVSLGASIMLSGGDIIFKEEGLGRDPKS
jgi:hypothetical protein